MQIEIMKTLSEFFKSNSAYWGQKGNWLVVMTTNRDADCLTRSNFRSMVQLLGGKATDGAKGSCEINSNLAIEEATHWACGWVQYLVLNPAAGELVQTAKENLQRLENYPVLDEEDFSNLEMEEANEIWANCYRPSERLEYIRKHKSQFEFRGLADLMGCVRGKYFAGYASELIG